MFTYVCQLPVREGPRVMHCQDVSPFGHLLARLRLQDVVNLKTRRSHLQFREGHADKNGQKSKALHSQLLTVFNNKTQHKKTEDVEVAGTERKNEN